jgi:alkanesulfonate monooxygenase SsuD/methylene tetrahydromethanopterin reductase-like flavin-dependent oxidoreductase (luciferase family)
MSIEFIGIAATAPHSETEIAPAQTDPVQPGYLGELARAHEEAGFDAVTGAAGTAGNSAALVGSYEQVAQALLRSAGPGVSTLLIRGLTPPDGARDCGTLVRLACEQAGPAALASAR